MITCAEMELNIRRCFIEDMKAIGNKNISVGNVRFFHNNLQVYAVADVSFLWWGDNYNRPMNFNDMIFTSDGKNRFRDWTCPLVA